MNEHPSLKDFFNQLEQYIQSFDWSTLTKSKLSILQAFLRLATKHGFASVSMRNLAHAVDLRPASIYSHFPNGKDEIVASALRWHYHTFALSVRSGLQGCNTPHEFLYQLVRVHITEQIKRPENDLWDTLMTMDRLGEILQPSLREEMLEWMAFCDSMYEAVAINLDCEDAKLKSAMIRIMLDGANSWWKWDGTEKNLEQCISHAHRISLGVLNI